MKRFQPSLLGGLFIGIVSALPIVGAANVCCCLWVVTGGLLTVYLQRQGRPEALDAAEAVLGGLVAGLLGAVINIVITGALMALSGTDRLADQIRNAVDQNPQLPPDLRDRVDLLVNGPRAPVLVAVLFAAVVLPMYAVFGMLGALLGFAMFRKSSAPPPPAAS